MTPAADLHFAAIQQQLRTAQFGRTALRVVDATGSTNADLLAAAADAPHGAVLIADRQTAGRGRKQREWWSQPGKDLLLSLLLRPPVDAERLPALVYAAGLAAWETISRALGSPASRRQHDSGRQDGGGPSGRFANLKWPNDVLVDGRKICGILCESLAPPLPGEIGPDNKISRSSASPAKSSTLTPVVVGFGVNVNSPAATRTPEQRALAVSLLDVTGEPHDRAALAASLLAEFENQYERWLADPLATLRAWEARARLAGRRVRVRDESGAYAATAVGIDDAGRLLVAPDSCSGEPCVRPEGAETSFAPAPTTRRLVLSGDVDWAED